MTKKNLIEDMAVSSRSCMNQTLTICLAAQIRGKTTAVTNFIHYELHGTVLFLVTAVRISNSALYTISLIQNHCTWLWVTLNILGIRPYQWVLHNLQYKR
jgi:uncharacterized membrane protein